MLSSNSSCTAPAMLLSCPQNMAVMPWHLLNAFLAAGEKSHMKSRCSWPTRRTVIPIGLKAALAHYLGIAGIFSAHTQTMHAVIGLIDHHHTVHVLVLHGT